MINKNNLNIDPNLFNFINNEALINTGIDQEKFWNDFSKIVDKFINSDAAKQSYNICTGKTIDFLSLAKIINDIPFPIPRSLICSPTHIKKAVPAVSVMTVKPRKPQVFMVEMTTGEPSGAAMLSNPAEIPKA